MSGAYVPVDVLHLKRFCHFDSPLTDLRAEPSQ